MGKWQSALLRINSSGKLSEAHYDKENDVVIVFDGPYFSYEVAWYVFCYFIMKNAYTIVDYIGPLLPPPPAPVMAVTLLPYPEDTPEAPPTPTLCKCYIVDLMIRGCVCGGS